MPLEELFSNFAFPVVLIILALLGIRAAGKWLGPFITGELWPHIKQQQQLRLQQDIREQERQYEDAAKKEDQYREDITRKEEQYRQDMSRVVDELKATREAFQGIIAGERLLREAESKQSVEASKQTVEALHGINAGLKILIDRSEPKQVKKQ